jgi:hypothetical protein
VATAQIEAWVGTHRGTINVGRRPDLLLADAALARMMLYRRRAVAAGVIGAFRARMGARFGPFLEGRPHAPADPAAELASAKAAGDIVANIDAASPPLLFERALVAEAEGRLGDAQTDLQRLLAPYPGFSEAAIAAARVALTMGDPSQAIHSLAAVEGEMMHLRDGAALLADTTRAMGLYETASRYDLAALLCRGAYDSRGNDCAPVDVTGKTANDDRMPQIFYFESQPDGSIIANAHGVYYRMNPLLSRSLLMFKPGQTLSTIRSLGVAKPRAESGRFSEACEATTARLLLFLEAHPRLKSHVYWLRNSLAAPVHRLSGRLATDVHMLAGVDMAVMVFLYRSYRRLPVPVRAAANKLLFGPGRRLLPWLRDSIAPNIRLYGTKGLSEISDREAVAELARSRYELGLARIFGLRTPGGDVQRRSRFASIRQQLPTRVGDGVAPRTAGDLQMPAANALPPLAVDTLRRLLSKLPGTEGSSRPNMQS